MVHCPAGYCTAMSREGACLLITIVAKVASVGMPPSIRCGFAGAWIMPFSHARHAYFGRRVTSTRNWDGTMSKRSETSLPIMWRSQPQSQMMLSGAITSSTRGRCGGNNPRLVRRGLGFARELTSCSSSEWIAAIAVSISCSASSYWSVETFSDFDV